MKLAITDMITMLNGITSAENALDLIPLLDAIVDCSLRIPDSSKKITSRGRDVTAFFETNNVSTTEKNVNKKRKLSQVVEEDINGEEEAQKAGEEVVEDDDGEEDLVVVSKKTSIRNSMIPSFVDLFNSESFTNGLDYLTKTPDDDNLVLEANTYITSFQVINDFSEQTVLTNSLKKIGTSIKKFDEGAFLYSVNRALHCLSFFLLMHDIHYYNPALYHNIKKELILEGTLTKAKQYSYVLIGKRMYVLICAFGPGILALLNVVKTNNIGEATKLSFDSLLDHLSEKASRATDIRTMLSNTVVTNPPVHEYLDKIIKRNHIDISRHCFYK